MNNPGRLRTRSSPIRDRVVLAAETEKAAGIDMQDTNISVGSAYYHAKKSWVEVSEKVQEEFQCPDHVSVHWDSKMVEVTGSTLKSNRCCIVV